MVSKEIEGNAKIIYRVILLIGHVFENRNCKVCYGALFKGVLHGCMEKLAISQIDIIFLGYRLCDYVFAEECVE